ncbi:MAG: hypothetical protein EXS13_14095 [Planctomycetes bacterium]|nr:hypothetical protein [Planctomycetota bacterium]
MAEPVNAPLDPSLDDAQMQEIARLRRVVDASFKRPTFGLAEQHEEIDKRRAAIEHSRQRENVTVALAFDRGQLTNSDLKLIDLVYVSTALFDSFGESSRLINRVVDWSDFAEPLQLATSVRSETVEIRTEVTMVSAEGAEVESLTLAIHRRYGGFPGAIDRAHPGPIWGDWSSSEFVLAAR